MKLLSLGECVYFCVLEFRPEKNPKRWGPTTLFLYPLLENQSKQRPVYILQFSSLKKCEVRTLRRGCLWWCGPPCSTWVFLSRGSTGRTFTRARGELSQNQGCFFDVRVMLQHQFTVQYVDRFTASWNFEKNAQHATYIKWYSFLECNTHTHMYIYIHISQLYRYIHPCKYPHLYIFFIYIYLRLINTHTYI